MLRLLRIPHIVWRFVAPSIGFSVAVSPFVFTPVFCEPQPSPHNPPKLPSQTTKISPILAATQLQLDATVLVVDQILTEYEHQVSTLNQLELRHHILLRSSHGQLVSLEDELIAIRNDWMACCTRCSELEYCLDTALTCLTRSIDMVGLINPLFSIDNSDCTMYTRAGNILLLFQQNFADLQKQRNSVVQTWGKHTAEHIKQS